MTNNINSYDLLFLTNKEYSKHIEKKKSYCPMQVDENLKYCRIRGMHQVIWTFNIPSKSQ